VEQLECPFVDKFFSKAMIHWKPAKVRIHW